MTSVIENGRYKVDSCGRLIQVDGAFELIEQAKILLTVKKGSFRLDEQLGNELHNVDLNRCDDGLLYSLVCEALEPVCGILVVVVSRMQSKEQDALCLNIELLIDNCQYSLGISI